MPKRFTDTEKWRKPWFRKLPQEYKLLWFYILDDCDHAGIWQVDIDVAEIRTGEEFDVNKAIEIFDNKIYVFDNKNKWFIPSFIEFQYGKLNKENRAHNSVISILEKYNLMGVISPLQGAKDKDKDMDMVMVNGSIMIYNKEDFKNYLYNDLKWIETIAMNDRKELKWVTEKMRVFWKLIEESKDWKTVKEMRTHFINWKDKITASEKGEVYVPGKKAVNPV